MYLFALNGGVNVGVLFFIACCPSVPLDATAKDKKVVRAEALSRPSPKGRGRFWLLLSQVGFFDAWIGGEIG